ncbi:uncharacterized protein LOC102808521 [Saccoglossus kowalevskii]
MAKVQQVCKVLFESAHQLVDLTGWSLFMKVTPRNSPSVYCGTTDVVNKYQDTGLKYEDGDLDGSVASETDILKLLGVCKTVEASSPVMVSDEVVPANQDEGSCTQTDVEDIVTSLSPAEENAHGDVVVSKIAELEGETSEVVDMVASETITSKAVASEAETSVIGPDIQEGSGHSPPKISDDSEANKPDKDLQTEKLLAALGEIQESLLSASSTIDADSSKQKILSALGELNECFLSAEVSRVDCRKPDVKRLGKRKSLPKKVVQMQDDDASVSEDADDAGFTDEDADADEWFPEAEKTKKGPRKKKVFETSASKVEEISPPKKPRGRPAKVAGEIKVKRGRGRPRKYPDCLVEDVDGTKQNDKDEATEEIGGRSLRLRRGRPRLCQDGSDDTEGNDGEKVKAKKNKLRYGCSMCGKSFAGITNLEIHFRTHTGEKPYTCDLCPKSFNAPISFKIHQQTHSSNKPYQCELCGKTFKHANSLTSHKITHTKERPYTCKVCHKGFTQTGSLKSHMRLHTGEKPYQCEQCGKSFAQANGLRTHKMTHTGEKPYKCHQCERAFNSAFKLKSHIMIHTGDFPHQCDLCARRYTMLSELRKHVRKNHLKEKPYLCDICGKSFGDKNTLGHHKKIHSGTRDYHCTSCTRSFYASSALKKHMRTHTGEKPFSCTVCLKSFSRADNLRSHMKIHSSAADGTSTSTRKQSDATKLFHCSICTQAFTRAALLKKHDEQYHSGGGGEVAAMTVTIPSDQMTAPNQEINTQSQHINLHPEEVRTAAEVLAAAHLHVFNAPR